MAMLTATPNTEAPLAERFSKVLRPREESQRIAIRSTRPEFCFSGRKLGGKSWVLGFKATAIANRYGPNHPRKYPAARIFLCREERAQMDQSTIYTMRHEILGPALYDALISKSTDTLTFPNGSTITFSGLDKPERIQGTRYMFMGIDQAEQLNEDQFETANAGCTQIGMPWTQTFSAFNPENPDHWAYLRYRPDEGDGLRVHPESGQRDFAEVVHVKLDDLVDMLTPEQRERRERWSGIYRDRWLLGRWVAFTGTVFDSWDPTVHVVDAPESWAAWDGLPPPSWPRWRGVDFGYNPDPYAVAWVTRSPDGVFYLYRQEERLKLTLDVQTRRVLWFENQERAYLKAAAKRADLEARARGEKATTWAQVRSYLNETGDMDDEPGLDYTGYSDHEAQHRAMYRKAGIASQRANKDIDAGIETMHNLLDPTQERADGTKGPRFLVVRGSLLQRDARLAEAKRPTCFEEEIGRYLWDTKKTAGGNKRMKDKPVDANNHMLDAVRYVLHTASSAPTHYVASGDDEGDAEGIGA
jgi:phage terminase large subunit